MYDINAHNIEDTATMKVRTPDGERAYDADGNELSITLYGPGSKQYQKAKHAAELRASDRMMAKMQGKADGRQSAEDKAEEDAEFLASCTVSFNNFGNSELQGHALFKATYADPKKGHIAEDVTEFIKNRANFYKPSTTN